MHISKAFWSCLSYLTNILTLSVNDAPGPQHPLGGHGLHAKPMTDAQLGALASAEVGYLKFPPPSWRPLWGNPGKDNPTFYCEYPDYKIEDWEACVETDRTCWIRHKRNGTQYNISTNYEDIMPRGIVRKIPMDITKCVINADGMNFTSGKCINKQYPGPLIQACWGDTVEATVQNNLEYNGTAIHWHGIRQLRTMHMDGVPGITQCPIAPGDSFTYKWVARQYGTAWYHSHYSVQYADGLLGPMTIYGPHSAQWDEGKYPLIMNDWFHNSAYSVIHGTVPGYPTILLNGTGDISLYDYYEPNKGYKLPKKLVDTKLVNKSSIPPIYRLHFEPRRLNPPKWGKQPEPKRYLLRLVNAAFETGFVFSIDHHMLEVVSADFVAIKPFKTTHLHVGIGQRYNVIVTAKPEAYKDGTEPGQRKLFWIRTISSKCFRLDMPALQDYERTGVISYYDENGYDPKDLPTTKRWPEIEGDTACRDEDLDKLEPVFKWKVGPAANADRVGRAITSEDGVEVDGKKDGTPTPGERFDVVGGFMLDPTPPFQPNFTIKTFSFERTTGYQNTFEPMQIEYQDPIFLNLNTTGYKEGQTWPVAWAVVNETKTANGSKMTGNDWIYLALGGRHPLSGAGGGLQDTAGAHPIHLHGHDFAILQQETDMPLNSSNIRINDKILDNPPRRDVVLLPSNGFVVIAFKADNPGAWIMHCHIAFHASFGLALQVMERQWDALDIWPDDDSAIVAANKTCQEWKKFTNDCKRHWPGYNKAFKCYPACRDGSNNTCPNYLYDDSGI